jgi:two-component system sensor histidine kinase AlgZ
MRDPRRDVPWLPDLCRLPRLAALLGLAELVVLLLVLAPDDARTWTLSRFISASGLALWLSLAVAVLLCKLRAPISRLPRRTGASAAVLLAGGVAFLGAGVIHALYTAIGLEPLGVDFWHFSGGSAAVTVLIVALALRHFYVSDRWAAQTEANARAEADALQARIRPHFLFNSMNLIAGLLRRDPVLAERAVLDLSDLFRAALGAGEGDSTLAAECELAGQYLSIEQLRLGERLQVEWDKREPLPWELALPRLTLQPLVENAVLHGISRLPEGGTVSIALWVEGRALHLRVRNPAPPPHGPSQGALAALHVGAGHAQRSIAHRLAYRFGPQARVTAGWGDGYYACEVTLPLNT